MKRKRTNRISIIKLLLLKVMMICIVAVPSYVQSQEVIFEGFFDEVVSESWSLPVGIRFDENGNGFVWEKNGKVYQLGEDPSSKSLILDISEEVASWGDHGLTGFVIDPEFLFNGHIYVAYTVDRYHLFNADSPQYDKDSTILTNATIGRLTRYTLDIATSPYQLIPESRKILVGKNLTDGFPILADFHGVGSLAFGNDGSLFIGCGDSGLDSEPNVKYHTDQALKDGIIDSTMLLGSYRAQSIHSMNGKLLRINPATGDGLPSNPFFNADVPRSPSSRLWALGLRNPYKFVHIPGTGGHNPSLGDPGIIIIGDVGSSYWEEFNMVRKGGQNFGWPLYEGHDRVWPYGWYEIENPFAPNPLYGEAGCERKNFIFQDLISQDHLSQEIQLTNPCAAGLVPIPDEIPQFIHSRPFVYYNNIQWNQPTRTFIPSYSDSGEADEKSIDATETKIGSLFEGYSALPGAWYNEGSFPDELHNSLLVSDFSGWIKAFQFDEEYNLHKIIPIRNNIDGIVDLAVNPVDDCIYYINIATGQLRKLCFGGNPAPIAIASADTLYGGNELTVNFDASQSYDPNHLPIKYFWNFGDGNTSNSPKVSHHFTAHANSPTLFITTLTVTDSLGKIGSDTLKISLNNSPPVAKIISPIANSNYAVNGYNRVYFKASVIDQEEDIENLKFSWQVHLHHNLHYHSEEIIHQKQFSSLIEPVGCTSPDTFWYRITLKVEDSYGLEDDDEVLLFPNCNPYPEVTWNRSKNDGNTVNLFWTIDNSENLDYFIVQKISDSGNITDIGITDKDISGIYSFDDLNPITGENRYRLMIFSKEGKYSYSGEFTTRFPVTDPLFIYPNPSDANGFNVLLDQPFGESVTVEIFDVTGKMVFSEFNEKSTIKEWRKFIYSEKLQKGTYFVVVRNGERSFTKKVEIIR